MSVLVPQEKQIYLRVKDYIQHLVSLKQNKENVLFSKTIASNQGTIPIEESDINRIIYLQTHNKNTIRLYNNDDFGFSQKFLGFINDYEYYKQFREIKEVNFTEHDYLECINIKPFEDNENIFSHMNQFEEVKFLYIYEYSKICPLLQGSFFGEQAVINPKGKRNATILVNENTFLGTIDKKVFRQTIFSSNEKLRNSNSLFLSSQYIFRKINKNSFLQYFYSWFVFTTIGKGEILIQEGESTKSKDFLFLKEGEFEFSIYASLNDLNDLIARITGKSSMERVDKEGSLKFFNPKFKIFMEEKRNIKIMTLKEDILRLGEFELDNKFIFTVTCIGTNNSYFSLNRKVKYFHQINLVLSKNLPFLLAS